MSNKMQVTVRLDQRLMMSQQLRQAITLLQYNTIELKQLVQQCIETNPLIDMEDIESEEHDADSRDEQFESSSFSADFSRYGQYNEDSNALENHAVSESLRSHLLEQTLLCQFSDNEQLIAEALIDAIDDDGYLTMSLEEVRQVIADSELPSLELMQKILMMIQSFDPIGVGSRDLRESLLIQLDNLSDKDKTWRVAHQILNDFFDEFASNNAKKLLKKLGLTHEEYHDAVSLIRMLNPHPGFQFSGDININIEPELYVKKVKKEWRVFMADSILTNIKINKQYQELIKQNKKSGPYKTLRHELDEARDLLKGLKRRNETLFSVGSYIVELQQDFLEHGSAFMKPMNIIDVSQALNIHESTVSRITTGKYISTPRGVFELKYFFPSYVTMRSGDTCSAIAIKSHIKEILANETDEHILSDEEIAGILREKGVNIARRTVAKYREAMHILPSYQRSRIQSFAASGVESVEEDA
jgi:RNA polymerase sigma-54 factor